MSDRSDAIDRVRKLLASADPHGNPEPGEAFNAYKLAHRLMRQHKLKLPDVLTTSSNQDEIEALQRACAQYRYRTQVAEETARAAKATAAPNCGRRHTCGKPCTVCDGGKAPKPQTTRMHKLQCVNCGAIIRATRRTIDAGYPITHGCHPAAQFAEIV